MHLEAAHLVRRTEAVLQSPYQTQRGELVALELQHHIDQVLEHPRTCDLSVLGHVSDQDSGDTALLGHCHDGRGDGPHLVHSAWHAVRAGRREGLHRVQHEQAGLDRVEMAEDGGEVGLGGEVEPFVQGSDPFGPQPYLGGGLLPTDHQRRAGLGGSTDCPLLRDVEQECRLADSRLAGE
jgi:hypothetical protein